MGMSLTPYKPCTSYGLLERDRTPTSEEKFESKAIALKQMGSSYDETLNNERTIHDGMGHHFNILKPTGSFSIPDEDLIYRDPVLQGGEWRTLVDEAEGELPRYEKRYAAPEQLQI
ncbi:hypothetical protein BGZ95_009221 [Linnemannia exigua]|uniref:Uncharacterized protein n=1 Tax=Linnemannia exigua TaxID=604196 RepID=A0AAD4DKQ6_9FUNG|nr:hypothetical protein BGZ95_009221 [Linnemannia exigua]